MRFSKNDWKRDISISNLFKFEFGFESSVILINFDSATVNKYF